MPESGTGAGTGHGHLFADLTTDQVRDLGPEALVVQPIGAIEAHGPHLPLTTDALMAEEIAGRVAEDAPDTWWFLPTLAYGRSIEHAHAPGTITLSTRTALATLDDIGRSLASSGVRRVVFLNTHGGNSSLLDVASRDLRQAYGLMVFTVSPIKVGLNPAVSGREHGVSVHGGADETSIMLHLAPHLVRMHLAARCIPAWHEHAENIRFGGSVGFAWLASDLSPSGVGGDPTSATADWGAQLVKQIVRQTRAEFAEIENFHFSRARNRPFVSRIDFGGRH